MTSTKAIQSRIRSVRNTSQITKAMEVVSATKMRRAQEFAIRARPYAVASLEMLKNLLARTETLPPLLRVRPVKTSLLVVVAADKGLAGAYNANVLRRADAWLAEKRVARKNPLLMTVGKKARDHFERLRAPVQSFYVGLGDYARLEETVPVADEIINGFRLGAWDEVETVYTHFRTTLRQETVLKRILPVTAEGVEEIVRSILPERGRYAETGMRNAEPKIPYTYEYMFEPSPREILETLIPQLLRMHIHHIILESNASEHSSRMVAMKNASDNAEELIGELTLEYNKSRQAGITRELTEITAGKEALEQ